jgi:WD40 repeat protein
MNKIITKKNILIMLIIMIIIIIVETIIIILQMATASAIKSPREVTKNPYGTTETINTVSPDGSTKESMNENKSISMSTPQTIFQEVEQFTPNGKILFLNYEESLNAESLYWVNSQGEDPVFLGYFQGSAAFSNNGRYIATGCSDDTEALCIIDTQKFSNPRLFPKTLTEIFQPITGDIQRLQIPQECNPQDDPNIKLSSVSWSKDQDKIAIVCGNRYTTTSVVCIMDLSGESNCWTDKIGERITRVVWSPIENILAVDVYMDGIYLVDENGNTIRFLVHGNGPEWSPDGRWIAFTDSVTIGRISNDGKETEILFENPKELHDWREQVRFICDEISSNSCRIAWSPDGHFLAFTAMNESQSLFKLFRLNIDTGEISVLIAGHPFSSSISEADWGP